MNLVLDLDNFFRVFFFIIIIIVVASCSYCAEWKTDTYELVCQDLFRA